MLQRATQAGPGGAMLDGAHTSLRHKHYAPGHCSTRGQKLSVAAVAAPEKVVETTSTNPSKGLNLDSPRLLSSKQTAVSGPSRVEQQELPGLEELSSTTAALQARLLDVLKDIGHANLSVNPPTSIVGIRQGVKEVVQPAMDAPGTSSAIDSSALTTKLDELEACTAELGINFQEVVQGISLARLLHAPAQPSITPESADEFTSESDESSTEVPLVASTSGRSSPLSTTSSGKRAASRELRQMRLRSSAAAKPAVELEPNAVKAKKASPRSRKPAHVSEPQGKGVRNVTDELFDKLGSRALLKRDQELALAKIVAQYRHLDSAAQIASKALRRQPTLEELGQLLNGVPASKLAQLVADGRRARKVLVDHNIRLVISIAKKYQNNGLELPDLIDAGIDGLLKAVDMFQPDKGFKLSTYATPWVRLYCQRAIHTQGSLIRVPTHLHAAYHKITTARSSLLAQLGRPATMEELAAATATPKDKVEYLLDLVQAKPFSIEASLGEGSDDRPTLLDQLSQEEDPSSGIVSRDADSLVHQESAVQHIDLILSDILPERMVQVLEQRQGLKAEAITPYTTIAKQLGVTGERVRQVDSEALAIVRRQLTEEQKMELLTLAKQWDDHSVAAGTSRSTRSSKKTT